MSTSVVWLETSRNYKITSKKNCILKNSCAACAFLVGKFDAVLGSADSEKITVQHGSVLIKEATNEFMMITSNDDDIEFSNMPVIVCDRPSQSIQFILGLECA